MHPIRRRAVRAVRAVLAILAAVPVLAVLGSCAGPRDAETASRDADVTGEEVRYTAGGAECTGYVAWDRKRSGRRPGVLVVHEWWGHNEYVRERARQLAALGYTAFALDMYGDGKQAGHPEDAQKFMMEVFSNMAAGKARFQTASELLAAHPTTDPEHIAAIGYCFGGAIVLQMARAGADLDAVASFHGSLATEQPAQPGAVEAEILVCHGAADQMIPPEQVGAFVQEMVAAGAKLRFLSLPGALHGFTNPAATAKGKEFDLPLAYDAAADEASWRALERLLQDVFGR